jgi:dTMP kinase
VERLTKLSISHQTVSFPRYGNPSAFFVEKYLRGGYGSIEECGAKRSSIFYALDRFDASQEIRCHLEAGTHVIADRYVASNMGHQGSKITDPEERRRYLSWNDELEFGIMGLPRPDLNLVLHVPAAIALELKKQAGGKDGNQALDLHESNRAHIEATEACYLEIARTFPGFHLIECMDGDRLLAPDEVHEKIWRVIEPLLTS